MRRRLIAIGMLVMVCSVVVRAQAPASGKDPRIGTWKINLEKSKLAAPAPKVRVVSYAARPDGFTVMTLAIVDSTGMPHFNHTAYKIDGADWPLYSDANLLAHQATGAKVGTVSHKLVDAYTFITTQKAADGTLGAPITNTVSKDGKTLTQTVTVKNAQGQSVNEVRVFDKQ
jgi:hypothetical protein